MRQFETPLISLFEDDHLVLVTKPSGLPCHATVDKNRPHLLSLLKNENLILLHRLDVDTSGVLILCKTSLANLKMQELLKARQIEKCYWAVSENQDFDHLPSNLLNIRQRILETKEQIPFENYLAIKKQNKREVTVPVKSGGHPALSLFRHLKHTPTWTSFEVQIITGRKHQIRSHLNSLAWPILGDSLYNAGSKLKPSRMALHSWKVKFTHPFSGDTIQVEAPRPAELSNYF